MRVVYFGSGEFGLPTLAALHSRHKVVGVVTQPDRPAGRGGQVTPTAIGAWAAEHVPGVPLFKPLKVNVLEVVESVRAIEADAWVVIAFGQKLSRGLLADRFAVNLHASLLPRWRGAAPINAAILAGDVVTGNTVITLADRMDAGLILGQSTRPIDPMQTAGELHDHLAGDGPGLMLDVLGRHERGELRGLAQDESQVTIATKLSRELDAIDFNQPAEFLRRYVHAMTPWPGVTVVLENPASAAGAAKTTTLKLLRVKPVEAAGEEAAGSMVRSGASGVADVVRCGNGTALQLLEVQPAGKRGMSWAEYARGSGRWIAPGVRARSARDSA